MKTHIFCLILMLAFHVQSVHAETAEEIQAMKDGCDKGGNVGCGELGRIEAEKGNLAEAKKLFKKACEDGVYPNGCNNLATLEKQLGNIAEARRLLKRSCDANDMPGCFKLGALEWLQKNKALAKRLLNKACDAGENDACQLLVTLSKPG